MFLGTYLPKLDDKGRLVLPAKFREGFAEGAVMTKGQDRSVVIWPQAEFEAFADRVREASRSDARARAYSRVLFSGATDELPDRQGRITIPAPLRGYAGLDRDCVVVGNHATVELWEPGAWDEYLNAQEPGFADLAEEVVPGLF
ncbi:MAG: division/cell wall cluster transcriptional repressor MraZ [Candidatus Nanopelagicales bacterium]|nr:division/cell wall cluster transcriptional repressor MraZ [Candidatus Nanopelagicales bacterium]